MSSIALNGFQNFLKSIETTKEEEKQTTTPPLSIQPKLVESPSPGLSSFSGQLVYPENISMSEKAFNLTEMNASIYTGEGKEKSFLEMTLIPSMFSIENSFDLSWDFLGNSFVESWSNALNSLGSIDENNNWDLSLKNSKVSMGALQNAETFLDSTKRLVGFEEEISLDTEQDSKKKKDLKDSTTVSYDKFLSNLQLRANLKDDSQDLSDFFKEVFSKDTLKEIGASFTDMGVTMLGSIVKSLIPSIKKRTIIEDNNWVPSIKERTETEDDKTFFKKVDDTLKDSIKVEKVLYKALGLDSQSYTDTYEELFINFVSKNHFLGQHQFLLKIGEPNSKNESKERVLGESVLKFEDFRVQGITIPEIKKETVNQPYGNTSLSYLRTQQASSDHKAEIKILCDRYFDTLESLVRITGLGVQVGGVPGIEDESDFTERKERVYDLSTISDSNYEEGTLNKAYLQIITGRDLAKEFFMEENNLKLENRKDKLYTIKYAMLPQFVFEGFRITNLKYPFKFEYSTSAKLLEITASVTWTKMTVNWYLDGDIYYKNPQEIPGEY